jgi:prepilin-type N-terminal cleavage/methylation domain-containing protein
VVISMLYLGPMGLVCLALIMDGSIGLPETIVFVIGAVLVTQGIRSYSVSAPLLGLIPLLLLYAFYVFPVSWKFGLYFTPVVLLAPLLIPTHRRAGEMWRPRPLPKLRRKRSAFTLIELLIVLALITIFSSPLLTLSGTVHMGLERQAARRAAMEWVRDELALLRGAGSLPPPGVYPPSGTLRWRYPFLTESEIELRDGPVPDAIEVRFSAVLRDERGEERVDYVALLAPAGAGGATP